jgi:hypothetical protein
MNLPVMPALPALFSAVISWTRVIRWWVVLVYIYTTNQRINPRPRGKPLTITGITGITGKSQTREQ